MQSLALVLTIQKKNRKYTKTQKRTHRP